MRSYNRNSRSGGGRYRGGDSRRRDSGRREMHKAVCDNCGNDCEVPFRPSGDKPIYCSNCFEEKGGGGSQRKSRKDSGRSDFAKRDNTNKQLLDQVKSLNMKLDSILRIIESSVGNKNVAKKAEVKKATKKIVKKPTKKL
jgi:CxxC-x17-CxxC domain-containing protein